MPPSDPIAIPVPLVTLTVPPVPVLKPEAARAVMLLLLPVNAAVPPPVRLSVKLPPNPPLAPSLIAVPVPGLVNEILVAESVPLNVMLPLVLIVAAPESVILLA